MSLTKRWSEADCLSRIMLSHAPRQATVSLTLSVGHENMKKRVVIIAVLLTLVFCAPFGFYIIQMARVRSSVVYQDSDTHESSIDFASLTEQEVAHRLLSANPKLDARRSIMIRDFRLAGISGHHGVSVPGFQPLYATMRKSIRLKYIGFPPGDEFRKRAETYCLEYNSVILGYVTEKLDLFSEN